MGWIAIYCHPNERNLFENLIDSDNCIRIIYPLSGIERVVSPFDSL